jgi:aryl-alcohol dehydrogenase-like predicted oxidoreductase
MKGQYIRNLESSFVADTKAERLILGSWNWAWRDWGGQATSLNDVNSILDLAWDRGIRSVDTAPAYGPYEVEELLGKSGRLKNFAIHSKFGLLWSEPYRQDSIRVSLENPARELEGSLRRLGVEKLEQYFLHHPPYKDLQEQEKLALNEFFLQAKEEGKIVKQGLANATPEAHPKVWSMGWDVLQFEYNALHTWADDKILPFVQEQELQLFSPLARGFFTTKYTGSEVLWSEMDHRHRLKWMRAQSLSEYGDFMQWWKGLSYEKQVSPAALALAWVLAVKPEAQVLIGVRDRRQLEDLLFALDVQWQHGECELVLDKLQRKKNANR